MSFQEIDLLIKAGQQGPARQKLLAVPLSHIPRQHLAEWAHLARRLNMPHWILKALRPIIRPEKPLAEPPRTLELALYATALSRIGVFAEAEDILRSLDETEVSEVLLFKAQSSMLQWDCTRAMGEFSRYLQNKNLSQYETLVAQVNLAACSIWDLWFSKGEEVLNSIWTQVESSTENYHLIHAYAVELAAEMAIYKGDFALANEWVRKAQSLLDGSHSRYEFYAQKWRKILDLLQAPGDPQALRALAETEQKARELSEWETLRDCVFFRALSQRDDQQFLWVHNGTPYLSFRKRVRRLYQPRFSIPLSTAWAPTLFEGPTPTQTWDPLLELPRGKMRDLFLILSQDFYRPLPLGTVVSELYPDEYFNPLTSTQKAFQIVNRLRKCFRETETGLEIQVQNGALKLVSRKPLLVQARRQPSREIKISGASQKLAAHFGSKIFTARQAAQVFGFSLRSTQKALADEIQRRNIIRTSSGRSARYRLKVA